MKAPQKAAAPNADKPKVPLKAKPITNAKSENERLRSAMDQTRAAVHANKLPEQPPADNEHVAEGAEKFPESKPHNGKTTTRKLEVVDDPNATFEIDTKVAGVSRDAMKTGRDLRREVAIEDVDPDPRREKTNLGDWDQNGKPGGDAKALGTEVRPMPKDFKPAITVEGSRIVARQDGIEVPFINTEDKAFYAQQSEQQRQTLWRELERRRIRALAS